MKRWACLWFTVRAGNSSLLIRDSRGTASQYFGRELVVPLLISSTCQPHLQSPKYLENLISKMIFNSLRCIIEIKLMKNVCPLKILYIHICCDLTCTHEIPLKLLIRQSYTNVLTVSLLTSAMYDFPSRNLCACDSSKISAYLKWWRHRIQKESPPFVVNENGADLRDNSRLSSVPTLDYIGLYHALTTLADILPLVSQNQRGSLAFLRLLMDRYMFGARTGN